MRNPPTYVTFPIILIFKYHNEIELQIQLFQILVNYLLFIFLIYQHI